LIALINAIRIRIEWGREELLNPKITDRLFTVPLTAICVAEAHNKGGLYFILLFIACLSVWIGFYDLYLNLFRCKRINYVSKIDPFLWLSRFNFTFFEKRFVAVLIWFLVYLLNKILIDT
jgi:hypothetical protein